MLLKKLFRTLWQYKAQFISMVIMVALGVGVFLGFNVEWYSLEVNTKEIYEATGFADFRIYNDKGFTEKDLETVKTIDNDGTQHYYDLNGRRLSDRPQKGIYIYKGKKYSEK